MIPETLDGYDRDNNLGGSALGLAAGRADKVVLPIILGDSGDPVLPLSTWQTGSPLGFVDLSEDRDHIVRGQQLAARVDHKPYDQFALALLNAVGRAGTDNQGIPHVDYQTIPLDAEGRLRINFVGPPGTIPRLSFAEVWAAAKKSGPPPLDQRGRRVDLKDTIVVIGATARSLGDYHATPYANGTWRVLWTPQPRLMSGPEVQANIVATLDDGAYITTPWWLATLPLVTGIGARGGHLRPVEPRARGDGRGRPPSRLECHLPGGILLRHVARRDGRHAHDRADLLRRDVRPPLALAPADVRHGQGRGDRGRVLENDPGHLLLRGEERIITVLFADIRGFTAYSHGHTPREIIALLNAYFGAVVPILEDQGGTIDKYIGDGVMVIFGAPGDQPDHAPAGSAGRGPHGHAGPRDEARVGQARLPELSDRRRDPDRGGGRRDGRQPDAAGLHRPRRHRQCRVADRVGEQGPRHGDPDRCPDPPAPCPLKTGPGSDAPISPIASTSRAYHRPSNCIALSSLRGRRETVRRV